MVSRNGKQLETVVKAAKDVLGYEKRRQPDWFMENEDTLKKFIDKRNTLFSTWLRTHHHSHRQRYVVQRTAEIKRVKNQWPKPVKLSME